MSFYSIHFSPTGGTKKVASILAGAMTAAFREIDLCRAGEPVTLTAEDVCLIAVPSYGGRVPGIALERLKTISPSGAKAILVCVYGNREWDDTLTELQDTLESLGFVCVAAVAAVAEHSIFRQYASGRPDAQDTGELTGFAAQLRDKLRSGTVGQLNLAGSHGTYLKYDGVPFKPEGNRRCVGCGLCAAACPAGAIDPRHPRETDKETCISCMRCVEICSYHARDLNALALSAAGLAMAPMLGGRKKNYLFL